MNNHELNTLFICAFRYALGRKTYIASDIADILAKYKSELNDSTKAIIKKEILRNEFGSHCDTQTWDRLFIELSHE